MAKVLEEAKVKISKKKARELSITLETRIVSNTLISYLITNAKGHCGHIHDHLMMSVKRTNALRRYFRLVELGNEDTVCGDTKKITRRSMFG